MNSVKALETLFSALNVAQSKGAYTIKESAILFSAMQQIENNKPEEQQSVKQTVRENEMISNNNILINKLREEKQDAKYKLQDLECENESLIRKIKKLEKQLMVVPREVRLQLGDLDETKSDE